MSWARRTALRWRWLIGGALIAAGVRVIPPCPARDGISDKLNEWGRLWRDPWHVRG